MKYLKQFETTAAYNAAKPNLILPNVSLITENNKVEYNPSSPTPPTPSHDYVEIASTKWATMNIGANSVTDYGLYFQWGDTQGYTAAQVGTDKTFFCDHHKYIINYCQESTKYNDTDGKTVLDASDDAVTVAWGGSWRTPTPNEFKALISATTSAWTADYQGSGVSGLVLTDNTDNSKVLFFPAAGYFSGTTLEVEGSNGRYWSNTLDSGIYSYYMAFWDTDVSSEIVPQSNYDDWGYGFTVRGVLDE